MKNSTFNTQKPPKHLLWSFLALLALWFLATPTNAQITSAGTNIQNQAFGTYVDPDGHNQVIFSNLAISLVEQVYGINLEPDAGNAPGVSSNFALAVDPSLNKKSVPGGSVALAYRLENSGNGADTVSLSVIQATNDQFDLQGLVIYRDINANGRLDAGEAPVASSLNLQPGETVNLLVVGNTPTTVIGADVALLDLEARSVGGAVDNNNIAKITAVLDANVVVTKSAFGPDANNLIRYRIAGVNEGNRSAKSIAGVVVVDGVLEDGILLEDAIPQGTQVRLAPAPLFSSTVLASTVFFVSGAWTRNPDQNATKIGLLLSDAAPRSFDAQDLLGIGGQFELQFFVEPTTAPGGSSVTNSASVHYQNQDGSLAEGRSNTTVSLIAPRRGVAVGPKGQATGLAGGDYTQLDARTGLSYTITRTGDGQARTDTSGIADTLGARTVVFANTLKNTGNLTDTFLLSIDYASPLSSLQGVAVEFLALDGTTLLNNPVTLGPGQSQDFLLRFSFPNVAAPGGLSSLILATSVNDAGVVDQTRDMVGTVRFYALQLGPLGSPAEPELGPSDQQSKRRPAGTPIAFGQTVQNAGNDEDTYNLVLETPLPPGWGARWLDQNGQALGDTDNDGRVDTGKLAPGQAFNLTLELIPNISDLGNNNGNGWSFQLAAYSSKVPGLNNKTIDVVEAIDAPNQTWALQKSVSPAGIVPHGATLTYSVVVENITVVAQTNAVVTDALSPWLSDVVLVTQNNATDLNTGQNHTVVAAYDAATHSITWRFAKLPSKAKVQLVFSAKVRADTPDTTMVPNTAIAQSATFLDRISSNTTENTVLDAVLGLEKKVLDTAIGQGDQIDWELRVINRSKTTTLNNINLEDSLPLGLLYVPSTSLENGTPIPDPKRQLLEGLEQLTWEIKQLQPGEVRYVRFSTLGTAALNGRNQIVNTATAHALAGTGKIAVSSAAATAAVKVEAGVFAARTWVVGRVYLDTNDNNNFEGEEDLVLPDARVYLSTGQYVLTDAQGRYSFAALEPGAYVLRLDPITVPYRPKAVPEDRGRVGSRAIRVVLGVTQQDFPLHAPRTHVGKSRVTRVDFGAVKLEKSWQAAGAGFVVTLRLVVQKPLASVRIVDPLPKSDAPIERGDAQIEHGGTKVMLGFDPSNALVLSNLEPGVHVVKYAVFTDAAAIALTDPDLEIEEMP